jgi:hypothetical protein
VQYPFNNSSAVISPNLATANKSFSRLGTGALCG